MLPTITVDIGTTSIKLCLFDANATLVASRRVPTPTTADEAGQVYDVDELRAALTGFIRDLGATGRRGVERIAVTGVGESGGLVRPDLSLASPMILWHDQRGAGYLAPLAQRDRTRIYEVTGLPVNGNYGLSKAAWAVERAGSEGDGAQWLNIAEYVAALMTGERWAEPSLASRTMALDVARGTWSAEVCAIVGLDSSVFPELRPAAQGMPITTTFANEAGLPATVRVHVAGHDHMVGGVGAGLRPGEMLNSTGTTEGLLFLRDAPRLDAVAERSKLANGLACEGEGFTLFASIPTGGSAFETLQHLVGIDAIGLSDCVEGLHARYMAGSLDARRAPLVLPRFRGSPPPTKDSAAMGVIGRLRTDTSMEELVFGVFLGMVLQFRDVLDLFQMKADRIKVIGPASRNPLWQQLKADLLGAPLTASRAPEVVSRGAQALASGSSPSWHAADPHDVVADADRHARLSEWASDVAAQWDYLKGLPS